MTCQKCWTGTTGQAKGSLLPRIAVSPSGSPGRLVQSAMTRRVSQRLTQNARCDCDPSHAQSVKAAFHFSDGCADVQKRQRSEGNETPMALVYDLRVDVIHQARRFDSLVLIGKVRSLRRDG